MQIAALTQVDDADKQALVDSLSYIETALKKFWNGQPSFIDLQERIVVLKMILEKIGDAGSDGKPQFLIQAYC